MSYFGTCLDELLKRKKMKAVDLAKLSGVGEPMISRYRKGDQSWVSPDDLASLAKAISNDATEQAELIRAHLLDECHGPGSELVDITIRSKTEKAVKRPTITLPQDLENALEVIRLNIVKDKNLRDVIEGMANLFRYGTCATNSELAEETKYPPHRSGAMFDPRTTSTPTEDMPSSETSSDIERRIAATVPAPAAKKKPRK